MNVYKSSNTIQEVIIPGKNINPGLFPQHNCKENLRVTEETHSVYNSRNVVIGRYFVCKICSRIFKQYNRRGIK